MNLEIKIAHEGPRDMMDQISFFTDYDYALVHLYKKDEWYRNFFKEKKKEGREIILDNSLFELGEAFDGDEYSKEIEDLQPDHYVVPDVFNDYEKNLESAKRFLDNHFFEYSDPLIAIHGKSILELDMAYKEVKELAKNYNNPKIAIPFGSKAFSEKWHWAQDGLSPFEKNVYDQLETFRKARNRYYYIRTLVRDGSFTRRGNPKIHLLGNFSPMEFYYYKTCNQDYSIIDSVDTSHPVALGLEQTDYSVAGLCYKPFLKIDNEYEKASNNNQKRFILYNIATFRRITSK